MVLLVSEIKAAAPGKRLIDKDGLNLLRTKRGGKWVFRYSFAGKRRDMGIGSWPDISIADARRVRTRYAAMLVQGLDPISERCRQKAATAEQLARRDPTVEELIQLCFERRSHRMKNEASRQRWMSPLKVHIIPRIGRRRASELDAYIVRDAFVPIWRTKTESAKKAMLRLRMSLADGQLAGFKVDPFICDQAKHILGYVEHVETPITATPWQEVPALYAKLCKRDAPSALALRWIIVTGTRSESARGTRYDEIEGDVWTVPAERMKGVRGSVTDFRVPLSSAAMEIVEECREFRFGDHLFPSTLGDKPLTQAAIAKILDKLGEPGRPHGFRTSFRSWVMDTDAASWEVAETALSHTIGNKVERSYARSDLLERRRVLMEAWGRFVCGKARNPLIELP